MSASARAELARSRSKAYIKACRSERSSILDEFVAATGVNRKTAIELLRKPPTSLVKPRGRPKKRYGPDVAAALEVLWAITGYVCSKRLTPFLCDLIEMVESTGEWSFSEEVKAKLERMSASTCDRLLRPRRQSMRAKGRCMTKPGSLLKAQIPIRTHADWIESEPGYCEMDLVHHCDDNTSGEYLHTLTVTDVATGWTELQALKNRSQHTVLAGAQSIQTRLPFELRGLDSDSGSEFINSIMLQFCSGKDILFTRSRPYRKNDACRVEQKNWSVVRQNVGYDRFEGEEACRALNAFYRVLRLQVNFLQPSMLLLSKERCEARIRKKYDQAQTPCKRVLGDPHVPQEMKDRLKEQLDGIRPMQIAKEILRLRQALRGFAQ